MNAGSFPHSTWNRLPLWAIVALWSLVGVALPAAYGRFRGIRNPQDALIHDELTYLLQADTFARGRLTNPAPRHPEFFEAPYLLMEPTYQAKYPPAQGLFLALGERVFGHPIWGVWLSCGFFAGSLYWMLAGWTNRRWAMLGTAYAVAVLGITSSWTTTYWGGMAAAAGGALLLGGVRWTLRRGPAGRGMLGRAVITALGALVLVNARPYEGAVVCLACAPVLAWWSWTGKGEQRLRKVRGWCGPFLLVVALGGVAMAVDNQAVTGDWKLPPFVLHPRQYFTCGMFRFQPINRAPPRRVPTRVGKFYETDPLLNPGTPGGPELGARAVRHAIVNAFLALYANFVSPWNLWQPDKVPDAASARYAFLAIFLVLSGWFVCTAKGWGALHAAWAVVILEVLAGAAVWWNLPHYKAPIVCLCSFLALDAVRRVTVVCRRRWLPRILSMRRVILLLMLLIPAVMLGSRIERFFPHALESPAGTTVASPAAAAPAGATAAPPLTRSELLEFLSHRERPVLAVVSYDPQVLLHVEWVYNSADLDSQRVILAHDLGPEKNALLLADFPGRDVWHVRVGLRGATLLDNRGPR